MQRLSIVYTSCNLFDKICILLCKREVTACSVCSDKRQNIQNVYEQGFADIPKSKKC